MKETHVWFLDVVHPALEEALRGAGMMCHDGTALSRDEWLNIATSRDNVPIHGIVLRSRLSIDAEMLDAMPTLKWIARSGSGLENIDLVEAQKRGVAVFNSPEGNRNAVAEHAVGMLLNVLHKIRSGDNSVRSKKWERERHRGSELNALTVGILGYGQMGSTFAQCLGGFGCKVIAYDKYREGWGESPDCDRPLPHVQPVGLTSLMSRADVISLHLPLTDETDHLVNDAWIASIGHPVILINTSRGQIVDTQALLQGLQSGNIRFACLDVLEFEGKSLENLERFDNDEQQSSFEQLLEHPDVLLTPHVAGWTDQSYVKLSTVLAQKILLHHRG